MSENNSELNISNEHLLLINILNTMYNDNIRQINNLTSSNNEIRSLLTRILNNSNRERGYNSRGRSNYYNRNTFFYNRRSPRV
jgi:CHASE3 domain sensor protein